MNGGEVREDNEVLSYRLETVAVVGDVEVAQEGGVWGGGEHAGGTPALQKPWLHWRRTGILSSSSFLIWPVGRPNHEGPSSPQSIKPPVGCFFFSQ